MATISEDYNEYSYAITPKTMAVKSGETELMYLTAHLSHGIPMEDWIEIGAKREPGWEKPLMFIYGAIDREEAFLEYFPQYPWDWNEKRKFKLCIEKETGNYRLEWFNPNTDQWEELESGSGFPKISYRADTFAEYFCLAATPGGSCTYTEYFVRDIVDEADVAFIEFWVWFNDPPGQIHFQAKEKLEQNFGLSTKGGEKNEKKNGYNLFVYRRMLACWDSNWSDVSRKNISATRFSKRINGSRKRRSNKDSTQ